MKRHWFKIANHPLRTVQTSIRSMVEPFFYFWPWLISVLIFLMFLDSSQGYSLAKEFSIKPTPTWVLLSGLGFHLAVTTLGCWFSALASTSFERPKRTREADQQSDQKIRMVCHATWILLLSVTPIFAFAVSTNSGIVLCLALGWCLSVSAASYLGLRTFEEGKKGLWMRSVFAGRRHRFYFAGSILCAATTPLLVGALIASRFPLKLVDAGPLVLALVGTSALATLVGAVLIIVPLCLQARWLAWAISAAVLAHVIYAPLSIDEENPLLRDARAAATSSAEEWESECANTSGAPGYRLVDRLEDEISNAREVEENGELQPLPIPLFLVSAEGGGIRAAFWTAMGLGQMDLVTDGQFASRVISLSGVSGGSLGIATWLAAHEIQGLNPLRRLSLMADFLATDFLSPLIGGFFFLDAPRLLFGNWWPSARRDHVFEKSIFDRWVELTGSPFFAQPIRRLCLRGLLEAPFVFFNTTDATSGRWISLGNSNFHRKNAFPGFSNALDHTSLRWISIAQAVSISARFPFLSPGAEVGITPEQIRLAEDQEKIDSIDSGNGKTPQQTKLLEMEIAKAQADLDKKAEWPKENQAAVRVATLVDGGYFDNSGLSHTIDALEILYTSANRHPTKKILDRPVYALHFSNDPGAACLPLHPDWVARLSSSAKRFLVILKVELKCERFVEVLNDAASPHAFQFVTTPLKAIFSVRGEHARSQRDHLINRFFKQQFSRSKPIFRPKQQLKEFSLAIELSHMSGGELLVPIPFSKKGWFVNKLSIQRMYDQQAAWLKTFEVDNYKTPMGYLNNLKIWQAYATDSLRRWQCAEGLQTSQPPLGWTLNLTDRTLLLCLAGRAAMRQGFPSLTVPYTEEATTLPFKDKREPRAFSPMQ